MKKSVSLLLVVLIVLLLTACGADATSNESTETTSFSNNLEVKSSSDPSSEPKPDPTEEAYNNANACFSQERFADAAKYYIEAGDYKDAKQKLLEIYYRGVSCVEKGQYKEAFDIFDKLYPLELNDSVKYYGILTEYFKWIGLQDNKIILELYLYEQLSGISELKASMQSICYNNTYLIKLENIVSNAAVLSIKHEDVTSIYSKNGCKSAISYKYKPISGHRGDIAHCTEYMTYMKSIGARENASSVSTMYHITERCGDFIQYGAMVARYFNEDEINVVVFYY